MLCGPVSPIVCCLGDNPFQPEPGVVVVTPDLVVVVDGVPWSQSQIPYMYCCPLEYCAAAVAVWGICWPVPKARTSRSGPLSRYRPTAFLVGSTTFTALT